MHCTRRRTLGRVSTLFVWVFAVILVIVSGLGYRILAYRLRLVVGTPIKLPLPLCTFPMKIGNWAGKDVAIPENIQRAAGNDDCLNRSYFNEATNQQVGTYIAYTARPRTMLGHRPQVCYVAGGWVHDSTNVSEVFSDFGRKVSCLVHRFHKLAPNYDETVVLNYYIVNGQITDDERVFTGVGWRTPNIRGDIARYVAQVQISSGSESSVLKAATDMTDLILDYLPDKDGKVRAKEYASHTRGDMK